MTGRTGRTLLVTNDFPPRIGGIQSFGYALATRRPPESLVVYTSAFPGAADFDRAQAFPVVRDRASVLLPSRRVAHAAAELAASTGCDRVWFGAMVPLGLIAPALRASGVRRCVAQAHGHEAAWASAPLGRAFVRRIASALDAVGCVSDYTRRQLADALPRADLRLLRPGVEVARFSGGADRRARVRRRLGLVDRPTIVCVSRLVARKGQDRLIHALPAIQAAVPGTALLLVGTGRDEVRLRRIAARTGVAADVVFTGAVEGPELPGYYAAGDVFALPCRTRRAGLDVEGLGLVCLEAAAAGLPVLVGPSGGAPESVRDGETGYVLHGRALPALRDRLVELLGHPARAREMGAKGRSWVEREWRWDCVAARLAALLD